MADAPLYGLLLAGGKSRRMGTDKALLRNRDESQLARAMRLLQARVARAFVSTSVELMHEPERARFPQIVDQHAGLGPVAGILSAMDRFPKADWLVLACDLPNLSDQTLADLIAVRSRAPFVAYKSVHNGLPEPLCAIYRQEAAGLLTAFVDQAIRCPRKMMINSDTHLLDQPHENALDNVNTLTDLQQSVLRAGR